MLPRFFVPGASPGARQLSLPSNEAHHAIEVMRLRAGDQVLVFDGAGREWRAVVSACGRRRAAVELLEPVEPVPEPRVHVTLAQAVLKGDHMDAAVRDATMLGVTAIAPVITAHAAVNAAAASGTKARDRWTRVAISSTKQCRRAVVPSIGPAMSLENWLGSLSDDGERIVLAEPSATSGALRPYAPGLPPARAVLAVGPEGGWAAGELEVFAASGFSGLTLGSATLRAEAAALVALSVLRAWWRDL